MQPVLPVINAFWIGPRLGPIHAMCLRSFILAGHRVVLHIYDRPGDVPEGVETADAGLLMPESRVVRYKNNGSPSLFSNLFRLKILESNLGVYVDCDVFCLKPFESRDYLFGFEDDDTLNGAVLGLPRDSEMLAWALEMTRDPHYIAPWLKPRKRRQLRLRKALGLPASLTDYKWGVLGPQAITYFARASGKLHFGVPPDVFYPVHYRRVKTLLDPGLDIADLVTGRTVGIHLYNEMLKSFAGTGGIHGDSPLGQMFRHCGHELPG